jgi:pristinamycin I synthase 3 and 4
MNEQKMRVVDVSADAARQLSCASPASEIEKLIVNLWSEILDIDVVGVDANFLELGGNSVQAMQVISRLGREYGIHLPLRILFDGATPAGLAEAVSAGLYGRQPR